MFLTKLKMEFMVDDSTITMIEKKPFSTFEEAQRRIHGLADTVGNLKQFRGLTIEDENENIIYEITKELELVLKR